MIKYFIIVLGLVSQLIAFDHGYKDYNLLLNKCVSAGLVDYKLLKNDKDLVKITSNFERVDKDTYNSFSKNQKLAFLINVYNIFTIKLIVKHYPVSSIKKIALKPWDKNFIKLWGKEVSLNYIEHKIIRKNFNEPRIHFALVCAAKGCPILQNYAYQSSKLNEQMSRIEKEFLNDTAKNQISAESKSIKLSKIFKWYGSDFDKNYGSYVKYISKTTGKKIPDSVKVNWLDYNWDLNSK